MDALSELPPVSKIRTLKGYAEWMRRLVQSNSVNTEYKLHSAGFDEERSAALLFGTFGGFSQYVYIVHMNERGKCEGMVKVWNDAYASINVQPQSKRRMPQSRKRQLQRKRVFWYLMSQSGR